MTEFAADGCDTGGGSSMGVAGGIARLTPSNDAN
jgi:hypothetical protein